MARKSRRSKPRPPKMGRKWAQDDLLTYNIKVVHQDLSTFFGVTDLPFPDVEPDALTARDVTTAADYRTFCTLSHMDRMTDPLNREPATIDFVRELFSVLRYPSVEAHMYQAPVIRRHRLRFLANQGGRPLQVDVCIVDDTDAISLVVKVDRHLRGSDPEPRLISDAVAAFHNDNIMRTSHLGTSPLTSKVMLGIVMDGTMPTFYKIPVMAELARAVESGQRPEEETIVHAYRPEVPRPEEGMRPLDNRHIILSCFEAFRKFL